MQTITTDRLILEPLVAAHAPVMFEVLSDIEIYRYLDYSAPPSLEHLRGVYSQLEARTSPDGTERWLNWVVIPRGQFPVGYVQATITSDLSAWVSYVLASAHWGQGYATEATDAMLRHLAPTYGIVCYFATVEMENQRSIRLLERLAFHAATAQESEEHDLSSTERLFVRQLSKFTKHAF